MTFWIGPDTPGGVHVLIVGVGTHQGTELEQLPGAAYSASALATWWVRSFDRMLSGHHLASIDVLISSEITPHLPHPTDGYRSAEAPTQTNVLKAFEGWKDRSQNGALAVLHWVGHGENVGSKGPTHALYCSDIDAKGRTRGIDWTMTATAINDLLADRAICFVDACRSVRSSAENPPVFPSALESDVSWCPERSAVLYSTSDEDNSYCKPGVDEASKGRGKFHGGAIFSQALMWALDGYAGTSRGPKPGASVHEDDLVRVMHDRVELWRQTNDGLEDLDFKPKGATVKEWFGRPIVAAPDPVSSVRLWMEDQSADPQHADFEVLPRGGVPAETVIADQWHIDMPHGSGWEATAKCAESKRSGAKNFAGRFDTVHPFQQVEMAEVTSP